MAEKDNGVNEITLSYSIAELGLVAAAMHMGGISTFARGGGKNSRAPYFSMAERARKICPLPEHGGREYGWFDGFTALESGKSYSVYLDRQPQKSFEPDEDKSLQLVLVVDGKRFNLTDCLEVNLKDSPVPAEYLEMLRGTDELAKRAAPLDAERNSTLEFSLESEEPKAGFKTSKTEDRRAHLSKAIVERIGIELDDQDFYITSLKRDYYAKGWNTWKINVVAPQERIDQIKAAYDLESAPSMKI
jgi:hypothetical protein